jgi:hypothetical protein
MLTTAAIDASVLERECFGDAVAHVHRDGRCGGGLGGPVA